MKKRSVVLILYFIVLFGPIYWMVITSLKTDVEILQDFTLIPREVTFENYREIFTSEVWRSSFMNSLIYVLINVPDFHLEVWRAGKRLVRHKLVVGRARGTKCDEAQKFSGSLHRNHGDRL